MKVNSIENEAEEGNIVITLGKADATFLHQVSATLEHMLNVDMPINAIVSKIIENFQQDNTYVSLLSISKKVKLSLGEINRLTTFSMQEKRALDYMLSSHRRNPRIEALIDLLKQEIEVTNGTLAEFEGESLTVVELEKELEKEYDIRFRNQQLRRGIKKLIIKSVIISGVNRNSSF